MKKTNFFKLFLVGAVALTLGFSSCQDTVSQKDFEAVCKDIDLLKTDVDQLKKDLAALGSAVKDVTLTSPNELTVTYTNGNTAKVITIVHPEGGDGTTPGTSFITINDAGNWEIDGVDTGAKASELAPRINTTTDGNHFWEFPVVGADKKITWVAGPKVIAAAYAVNNNGAWTLYLPTADHTELQTIPLPSGSTGGEFSKIDILGWVEDFEATDNLSVQLAEDQGLAGGANATDVLKGELYDTAEDTFVVYYNVIEKFTGDSNGASQTAVTPVTTTTPPATWPYAIENVYTGIADAFTTFGIAPGTVLNTLGSQNKGFIVQVHPSGANISTTTFVLEDSRKRQLPVAFENPVLVSGLLTRLAVDSDIWFIEGKDNVGKTFKDDATYAGEFAPEALYTLVSPSGNRSEYTPFTITPTLVQSLEAQVIEIDGELFQPAATPIDASFYVQVGADNKLTFEKTYFFEDDAYTVYPNDTRHTAEIGGADPYFTDTKANIIKNGVTTERYTNAVIAQWMKVGSNPNDTYITTEFGIYFDGDTTNKKGGSSFTVGQLPDELTEASFNMDVYKLGIDGIVYYEHVRIHPVRKDIITPIDIGEYIVEDGFPGITGTNSADYLGSVLRIPQTGTGPQNEGLDKMFADLRKEVDRQTATMEQRWQDDEYGAMYYTVTNLTIDGITSEDEVKGELGRFMFPNYIEKGAATSTLTSIDGGTTNTSAVTGVDVDIVSPYSPAPAANPADLTSISTAVGQSTTILGDKATAIFAKGADGKILVPAGTPAVYPLYDTRSIDIYPNYAYFDGADDEQSFVIDKKHTFTVVFYDKNNMKLNTIVVSFTPKLPPMTELFKREPQYWSGNTLNAYYKTPDNWYNSKFYGVTPPSTVYPGLSLSTPATGAENSTFYNVYNPGGTTTMDHTYQTPLDGGYTKVGIRNNTDHQWVNHTEIALDDAANQKFGTVLVSSLVDFDVNYLVNTLPTPGYINMEDGFAGPTTAKSVIEIYNQTNPYTADVIPGVAAPANFSGLEKADDNKNAYDKLMHMVWNMGPYIGFYKMAGTEKFDLRIMSAVDKGGIKGTTVPVDTNAALADKKFVDLTDENVKLENYNHEEFSVFKKWDATLATPGPVYAYTYIYNVEFSRPDEVSTYDIMIPDTANAGEWIQANEGGVAVPPTATAASYIALRPNNITGTSNTSIHVRVYDRFGRVVEGNVPITIKVAE